MMTWKHTIHDINLSWRKRGILWCKSTYSKEFIFSKFAALEPYDDKKKKKKKENIDTLQGVNFSVVAGSEWYSDKKHALKRVHFSQSCRFRALQW